MFNNFQVIPKDRINNNQKIPYLNGLRAIAILIVIIGHINIYNYNVPLITKILFSGGLGVTLFFTISGFLITTLFINEEKRNLHINLKFFYLRRLHRIIPLAFFYIFVIFLMNLFLKLNIQFIYFIFTFLFLNNITRIFTSINSENSILLGHFWSLSVEEQFYLFYPIFFKFLRKYLNKILFFFVLFINFFKHLYPNSFIYHFESIAIGSLLSLNYNHFKLLFSSFISLLIFFSFILIFIYFFLNANILYTNFLISLLFSLIIFILLENKIKIIYLLFNNKILENIGMISYSLYIWQQLFLVNNKLFLNIFLDNLLFKIISLFIISFSSYLIIEKKFLKIGSKYKV